MHKSNIRKLDSEYTDLINKRKDYNLTANQRKEIDDKINDTLNDIKISENKIDEINKLKSSKDLEILEQKILIYQYQSLKQHQYQYKKDNHSRN